MRDDQTISAEIGRLKKMLPFIFNTRFCPKNTANIAAQIEVLEKRMSERDIERKWYVDETTEDYNEGDNDVWSAAREAGDWLREQNDQLPPSHRDNWGALAKGNGYKGDFGK